MPRPPFAVERSLRSLGQHVSAWRKLQRVTAAQLAERAGITRDTLRSIEQGSGTASSENVLRYLEVAEVAEVSSPHPAADLAGLYRRIVFSALTANTDDHLRNHGFLRTSNGWQLAPAYDLNPNPDNPGQLATAIDLDDGTCDVDLVLAVAGYFRLSDDEAKVVVIEIKAATRDWRGHARCLGLPNVEIAWMEQAFDGEFRTQAAQLRRTISVAGTRDPAPGTRTGGEQPRLQSGRFTFEQPDPTISPDLGAGPPGSQALG